MFTTIDEPARPKPNLRRPNQTVTWKFGSGHVRHQSQLHRSAALGSSKDVKDLLLRGADVNRLDDANGSALLCALQLADNSGDRSTLDLLLAVQHSVETLNSATIKKGLTPLQVAIDYGEPDVVEKLLAMGTHAELHFGVPEKISPLYHCIGRFAFITKPVWAEGFFREKMFAEPDAALRETIRRYSGGITGPFGELRHMLHDKDNARVRDAVMTAMHKQFRAKYTIENLTRITALLLEHGAQPNARHNYPVPGRTPLMLAAECDALEALELMLHAGGDPYKKDNDGQDCLRIALGFESRRVLRFLREKGIF